MSHQNVLNYIFISDVSVGRDTPASIPDVFAHLQNTTPSLGGLTGSGFRVAGAGGLANIASILGASGIKFRPADDSDDEEEIEVEDKPEAAGESSKVVGPPE